MGDGLDDTADAAVLLSVVLLLLGESGGVEVAQEQGRKEDGEDEVEDEEERVADDKRGEDHLVAVCVEGVEWDGEE